MHTENLRIFCPVTALTEYHDELSAEMAGKMKLYMTPGCIVNVIHHAGSIIKRRVRHVVEVTFPWQKQTDFVSPEYLHTVDNATVNKYLRKFFKLN